MRNMDRLKQAQQMDAKMIKELEHLSDKGKLSELRLFSLEEKKLMEGVGKKAY